MSVMEAVWLRLRADLRRQWRGQLALAVVGQLLNRQLIPDPAEFPILRALGMSRSRLALRSE